MNLQQRVTDLLSSPRHEWAIIATERDDVASLYRNYIARLCAIPAVAMLIGMTVFGAPLLGRYGLSAAISASVSSYVSALVGPIVQAVVIERLAPRFQSEGRLIDALKLAGYATTPVWVAGAVYVFPALAPLVVIAVLYAIYLFYLGLPSLMKTPPEQVIPFMLVAALVAVVVNIVVSALTSSLGVPRYGL